ncbi:UPF0565 protein C2orf69 homolog [Octopus sinensis]|uniref:UPF0565 protein C2orf69 homolog n=1 Tax=Octopus sinensis TaxID=2607531 RepID=A0A6P7TTT9_9MOLL|nr:UPF0565 protein C2orf69 homolog [Octopus sinensis]
MAEKADEEKTTDDICVEKNEDCRRFLRVHGSNAEKHSDVIVCGDFMTAKKHVIYFGGDIQDYSEKMLFHAQTKKYNQWNLENTAILLQKKFPDSFVFVVKPSKLNYGIFSVFSNFVISNDVGVPDHSVGQGSWHEVERLYHNTIREILSLQDGNKGMNADCDVPVPVCIVGFSKGCIVLNQLVHDLEPEMESEARNFISSVETLYWLDGGHSGSCKKTWVTNSKILEYLAQSSLKISVHVTPYQLEDATREWIAEEEKLFVENLQQYNGKVKEKVYFSGVPRSIDKHFELLVDFDVDLI